MALLCVAFEEVRWLPWRLSGAKLVVAGCCEVRVAPWPQLADRGDLSVSPVVGYVIRCQGPQRPS